MISCQRHRQSVRTESAFSGIMPSPAMPSGYFSGWDISTKPARSVLNIWSVTFQAARAEYTGSLQARGPPEAGQPRWVLESLGTNIKPESGAMFLIRCFMLLVPISTPQ